MNIEEQYFTCKKCGESKLWGEFVKDKTCKDRILKRCKPCQKLLFPQKKRVFSDAEKTVRSNRVREWKRHNRDRARELNKKSYEKNKVFPEKMAKKRASTVATFTKNRERYLANRRAKAREDRANRGIGKHMGFPPILKRKMLVDWYVKKCLIQKGFAHEQIEQNPELINIQRIIIQTKRLCKT